MLTDLKLADFVSEVGSSSPAPGGGSVAALAGALSAALVAMVSELTIGKKGYERVEKDMEKIAREAKKTMNELLKIVDEDTEAFKGVMKAYKLPKTTEEEKKNRKTAIEAALKEATLVPLKTLRLCAKIADMCAFVAENGNVNAISDAGSSAALCTAAILSAVINIQINMASIEDLDFKEKIVNEMIELSRNIQTTNSAVETVITKISPR